MQTTVIVLVILIAIAEGLSNCPTIVARVVQAPHYSAHYLGRVRAHSPEPAPFALTTWASGALNSDGIRAGVVQVDAEAEGRFG